MTASPSSSAGPTRGAEELPPILASLLPRTAAETAEARCEYLLRTHVLEVIAHALEAAGEHALLVKGAGLALAGVYASPWQRRMGDIDLLVAPDAVERVVAVLERAGFVRSTAPKGRFLTAKALGEVELSLTTAGGRSVVEVHGMLDKIVARPIPFGELWGRARVASSDALRVPSDEDHLLLVVLHASTSELRHDIGFVDMALLAARELDWPGVERRARAWGLTTALHVSLRTLQVVGAEVPREVVETTRPRGWRAWALGRAYAVGSWPVAVGELEMGARWVARQAVWREDVAGWVAGVAGYAGGRLAERLAALRRG